MTTSPNRLDALHDMLDRVDALPCGPVYPTRHDLGDTALNTLIGYVSSSVPDDIWEQGLAAAENEAARQSLRWMPDPPEAGNEPTGFEYDVIAQGLDALAAEMGQAS